MAVVRDTSEATGLDQALAEIVEQAAGRPRPTSSWRGWGTTAAG
jgi:hypothetical protein